MDFVVEQKGEIEFKGKKYLNNGEGGFPFHSLALELTRKNFVVPSVVILDEKLEVADAINFYQAPQWLLKVAHFYGDDAYKKMKWEDFLKQGAAPATPPKKTK